MNPPEEYTIVLRCRDTLGNFRELTAAEVRAALSKGITHRHPNLTVDTIDVDRTGDDE